jgi:hypothetical protein
LLFELLHSALSAGQFALAQAFGCIIPRYMSEKIPVRA